VLFRSDNIVENLVKKLSEYIQISPTDKLEVLLDTCKGKTEWWFEDLIAAAVRIYTEKELQKRNSENV
jgi:hypothetical protein